MKFIVIFDEFVDDGRKFDTFCYFFQVFLVDVIDENEKDLFTFLWKDAENHVLC